MSSEWTDIGVVLAVFVAIAAMAIALDRRAEVMVDDGPEDEPYRIFTREFDRMIAATDLPAVLREASPDVAKGYLAKNDWQWRAQIARAEDIYGQLAELLPLEAGEADTLHDAAVLLMIDQSGSMRGEPMAWAAAGVRRLSDELGRRGANVAVAGYTTAGWHGGFARRKWRRERRPARPGRLCALLHIVYRPFDGTSLEENAWRQMLNPDVLRENVDGEALEWGADYLKNRPERRRILLVVSDGAPVDDATLFANGPSYMHRHFLKVRDTLLDAKTPELLAIGVGYRVSEFYPVSREAVDAGELAEAGLGLVTGK
jgi:cobaltochelatase CobT